MKRLFLLLLPAAVLLVILAMAGCDDESKPEFTRVTIFPECGVVPLAVECYATTSGGNETGDPTGSSNNLEMTWDFRDGGTGQTSINYHTFQEPGTYEVLVTAKDPDGNTATALFPVTVLADTLNIEVSSNFPEGAATTADTVRFDVRAEACDIDPDAAGDYVKLNFRWTMDGNTFLGQNPEYSFAAPGEYMVELAASYASLAVVRKDTLTLTITDPAPAP